MNILTQMYCFLSSSSICLFYFFFSTLLLHFLSVSILSAASANTNGSFSDGTITGEQYKDCKLVAQTLTQLAAQSDGMSSKTRKVKMSPGEPEGLKYASLGLNTYEILRSIAFICYSYYYSALNILEIMALFVFFAAICAAMVKENFCLFLKIILSHKRLFYFTRLLFGTHTTGSNTFGDKLDRKTATKADDCSAEDRCWLSIFFVR